MNQIKRRSQLRRGKCRCTREGNTYASKWSKGKSVIDTPEYKAWRSMKARCSPNSTKDKELYYDKGVRICERWLKDFNAFVEDMGEKPGPKYTLDRYPDPNGDYELDNCRWATYKEQEQNRRNSITIEYYGREENIREWARILGMSVSTLYWRYYKGLRGEALFKNSRLDMLEELCLQLL